jgi:hypothetical protein
VVGLLIMLNTAGSNSIGPGIINNFLPFIRMYVSPPTPKGGIKVWNFLPLGAGG